jgi:hypothetical protein
MRDGRVYSLIQYQYREEVGPNFLVSRRLSSLFVSRIITAPITMKTWGLNRSALLCSRSVLRFSVNVQM